METQTPTALNNDLENAANKAADVAQCASTEIKEKAGEIKQKGGQFKQGLHDVACQVQDIACKATKEAGDLAYSAGHRICDAGDTVIDEIRKKPVQSAMLALAVGFIGVLLSPRATRRRYR